jgi:tryptophan synthase alpha chain
MSRPTHSSNAVDQAFARCAKEKRAAFIPFLMSGDPSLAATATHLDALVAGGADLIELGIPWSDPIADGPVNQRAAQRALAAGATLSGILELVARRRDRLGVPIVLFTYFNPIHVRGIARFAEQVASSGVDGVLCVDLPAEEGVRELAPALAERRVSSIYLLTPTSTRERIERVREVSSGFVYYVSRTGVTGEQAVLPADLAKDVKRLRKQLSLPVAVGFGISSPAQVEAVGKLADGVVVGSALVRLVEEKKDDADLPRALEARVRELSAPLHGKTRRRA